MKASGLIKKLQEEIDNKGDLEVMIYTTDDDCTYLMPVEDIDSQFYLSDKVLVLSD